MQDRTSPVAEETQKSGIPRPDISAAHIVLLTLATRGPSSFRDLMKQHSVHALGTQRTENSFYTALARLKKRRHITRSAEQGYALTPAGEYAALKAYVRKEFVQVEKGIGEAKKKTADGRWDGRWRIILFDVPESKRPIRDYLRGVLRRIGCREFQRSMWIYPFKLPVFLTKLIADPQLRNYARVLTTYDIDYDEDLRRQFKLG